MVICYIIGCKSRSEQKSPDITFHTFPKDSSTRQLWICATGRQNWQPTKYTRICSRHFDQSCFIKTPRNMTFLKPLSIPKRHVFEQMEIKTLPTFNELPIDIPSTSHHKPTEIMTISTKVKNSESMEVTPRKQKLSKQLNRQKLLAETPKKKLPVMRSKNMRLLKKNADFSAVKNVKRKTET